MYLCRRVMKLALLGVSMALLGCASQPVPPTQVHQPMTMRPVERAAQPQVNGSIYQVSAARPLFEDRRARFVGDIITINIVERTQASKDSQNKTSRSGSAKAGIPKLAGIPGKSFQDLEVEASGSNSFEGKGANTSKNDFTSTLTVTVIEVLANGNLLVSGEKQIGIKQGDEYIRFSGIVNPSSITAANTVQSTQIADARIEYKANGFINDAQSMGWLQRFFLTALPF